MEMNSQTLLTEIFPFSGDTTKETFVSSSFDKSQFNPKTMVNTSRYKMYLLAYKQYAKSLGFKLEKLTFSFVAPQITKEAYELAFVLNTGYNSIGGVKVEINLFTLQIFYQLLLDAVEDEKWYIKNSIPPLCLSKAKVDLLVDNNLATLV